MNLKTNTKALFIIQTLTQQGYQALYAGGCVRDFILGLESNDLDIATNAKPDEIEALFPKTIPVGKAFGVIIVVIDGEEFEVATFRSDGKYTDGRRPDSIAFASLEEDANRRDITINGMFYDPLTNKIIDVVGGQSDLEQKKIRLIGNPYDRITEDKLRLMRVIRFAARFGFSIEESTYNAVSTYASYITSVSPERIASEMTKILRARNKKRALELLYDTGLLKEILPEISVMKGCEQPPEFHPEGDCWEHCIFTLEKLPENSSDELLWGAFLHDVGKPPTQTFEDRIRFSGHDSIGALLSNEILKRLKFSNEFVEHVCALVENHMKFSCAEKMRISKLKRFMSMYKFDEHLALHKADCEASHGGLEHYEFVLSKMTEFALEPKIAKVDKLPKIINGHDLIAMGYKQGPYLRVILTDIEDQQLEGTISNREQALEYIKIKYFKVCPDCDGQGIYELDSDHTEEYCSTCHGLGHITDRK